MKVIDEGHQPQLIKGMQHQKCDKACISITWMNQNCNSKVLWPAFVLFMHDLCPLCLMKKVNFHFKLIINAKSVGLHGNT